jgi:hypothetical protein
VQAENNPFFKRVDGNAEWNQVVDHFEDATTGVLQRNDPTEISKLVAHGLTFNRLLSKYASERARRQTLERDLMGGSNPATPPAGRPTDPPRPALRPQTPSTTAGVLVQSPAQPPSILSMWG